MAADPEPSLLAAHLPRPQALLLDFGGVVVHTRSRPGWQSELADAVHRLVVAAGCDRLTPADIELDIRAGAVAEAAWKDAMSRPRNPSEMTYAQFWGEFVAADWPDSAREAVLTNAMPLCRLMGRLRSRLQVRPGTAELLAAAAHADVPVAIVSNAPCGAVHREFLADLGWHERFAVQVYSDEVGVRKPNPEMIFIATRLLRLAPHQTWYVGDNFDRDVVCGRRAGVGVMVLMQARSTYRGRYPVRVTPDAVVAGPRDLLRLFTVAVGT